LVGDLIRCRAEPSGPARRAFGPVAPVCNLATEHTQEIERLEQIVNSGTTSVTTDGTTTQFDLAAAKSRLAELKRLDGQSPRNVKRKLSTLDLTNCW